MTKGTYSRERIEDVLIKEELRRSIRIIPYRYLETPLGVTPGDSRFASRAGGFTVLYASPAFDTAFIETIVRDRFTRADRRAVLLREVTERAWALLTTKSGTTLALLDLRRDGCVRLGAPTDAVNARNHAAGRALGRAVYAGHQDIDGLLFSSRLTGEDVYAVFDRGIAKLDAAETGRLPEHPELADALSNYGIRLIRTL